jgi:hypothetical protein
LIDAALRQQLPTTAKDSIDVAESVIEAFRLHASNDNPLFKDALLLIPDIEARIASGEKKYGVRLMTNNGRNATLDLLQECLDGINYSMQRVLETDTGNSELAKTYNSIFWELTGISIRVKKLLDAQE